MLEGFNAPKVKLEGGGSSQMVKPSCTKFGKTKYRMCLVGTLGFFGWGKDYYNMRDCPAIAIRQREAKKFPPSAPDDVARMRNHFYVLKAK